MSENLNAFDFNTASVIRGSSMGEIADAHGKYYVVCYDSEGNIKWNDSIDNLVTTVGKNLALDTLFAGSGYSATSYIGLISSVGYTGIPTIDDTMSSHSTWYEVSATTYFPTVAARIQTAWSGATSGSKTLSSALSYSIITNGGTVKGCFLVIGTGASASLGDTGGVLYSAGLFTGGDKTVGVGDTLQVTYTATM